MQCPKCKRDSPVITALVNGVCGFCFVEKYPPKSTDYNTTHIEVNGVWVPITEAKTSPSIFSEGPYKFEPIPSTQFDPYIHQYFSQMMYGIKSVTTMKDCHQEHASQSPLEAYAENMLYWRNKQNDGGCRKCALGITWWEEPWG